MLFDKKVNKKKQFGACDKPTEFQLMSRLWCFYNVYRYMRSIAHTPSMHSINSIDGSLL
jgi:hypothetical protein